METRMTTYGSSESEAVSMAVSECYGSQTKCVDDVLYGCYDGRWGVVEGAGPCNAITNLNWPLIALGVSGVVAVGLIGYAAARRGKQ